MVRRIMYQNIVIVLFFISICVTRGNADCVIDIGDDLGEKSPLILFQNTPLLDGSNFLLPHKTSDTRFIPRDGQITFLCSGNDNYLNISGTEREFKEVTVKCSEGGNFQFGQQSYPLADFQCNELPQSSIREVGTTSNGQKKLQIGYEMSGDRFVRLIDINFDESTYTTSFVNYTLSYGIAKRQDRGDQSDLDEVNYYNSLPSQVETYYTCSNQETSLRTLLGVSTYIKCSGNINYFEKAHLAPRYDFVYRAQQRATNYHVNVSPMWHSILNGNWKNLEDEIRRYASNTSRSNSNLIIYTGTLGVTTLQNNRNTQRSIYLGKDSNDRSIIPAPKWIWKVVYEPNVKEGIVFLVINNPYRLEFACSCVCAYTKWTLEWTRNDRSKGYVYCCTVENFKRIFSDLPDFEVTGLLTKDREEELLIIEADA